MTPQRSDDEDDPRDLIRVDGPTVAGPDALARIIDQSNREAAANRAQARELIKAIEGVQRSQEFLGVALREERRKSRWLTALLVLAPIVAAVGAWRVVRHVEAVQAEVGGRIERLAADERARRSEDAAQRRDVRVVELTGDVESLRRDLESSREALASERKQVADREAALAAAHSRGEAARGEIGAFEYELKSAKAAAHAESERAAALENRIEDLKADLDARSKAAWAPAPPASPAATVSSSPFATEPTPIAPPAASAADPPDAPLQAPPPPDPPVRPSTPEETEKARGVLNVLLRDAGDSVRYEFRGLGSVAGRTLRDVLVVGSDERGAVVRTIQAGKAEIEVDKGAGVVVIRFFDGKLIVGSKQAPFFDGTYGLVVRGDAAKWKSAASWLLKPESATRGF